MNLNGIIIEIVKIRLVEAKDNVIFVGYALKLL